MLFLALPVSTANTVYHASFLALVIGAVVVLVSAVTLLWSGSVRENDLSSRLASLESTRAQADAQVTQAQADLATAKEQVVVANAAKDRAEKEVETAKQSSAKPVAVVAGRQVTAENCGLFINFVRTVRKGKIILQANSSDAEATSFARQLSDMFKSAGYDVDENFASPTLLGPPPVGVQMKIRSMDEQPPYAGSLQQGLEFIGIDTSGALDDGAADSVIIYVGSKA